MGSMTETDIRMPPAHQVVDTGLDETSCFFADGDGEEVTHGHYYEEIALRHSSSFTSTMSSSTGNGTDSPIDFTSLGNSSSSSYSEDYSSSYTPSPITSTSATTTSLGPPTPSPVGLSADAPPDEDSSLSPGEVPPASSPLIFEGGDFSFSLSRRKVRGGARLRWFVYGCECVPWSAGPSVSPVTRVV